MPKTNVSPGEFLIDPRLPNFPSLVSQLQFPIPDIVAIPNFKIPIANGVPSMIFACVGNTTDHKHCHVGASVPNFGSFPELKEHCVDIRDVRFGKYADRITHSYSETTANIRCATLCQRSGTAGAIRKAKCAKEGQEQGVRGGKTGVTHRHARRGGFQLPLG